MEKVKEFGKAGFRNLAMAVSFGAYHLYVMEQERNSWRKEQELMNANQLLQIDKKLRENSNVKWW